MESSLFAPPSPNCSFHCETFRLTPPLPSSLQMLYKLRVPNPERFVVMRQAFDEGLGVEELFELTKIDRWWLEQMKQMWDQQVCAGRGGGEGNRFGGVFGTKGMEPMEASRKDGG